MLQSAQRRFLFIPTQFMCYVRGECMRSSIEASSDSNHATLALITKHHSRIALKKIACDVRRDWSSEQQCMLCIL